MNLAPATRALLGQALETYQDSPRAVGWLQRHLDRFGDPLRLAVVGASETGKSTLVRAIAGENVADEQAGMAWIGQPRHEPTLLDTPAIEPGAAPNTVENICMEADAVLYLVRHPHNADLGFLHTLRDHPIARAAAVNAIVVLSRADELAGGRPDALISARQVARRYRREPEVRELCQDVVPVSGLVACAARTLADAEFDALAALAATPREDLEPQLLSADRFLLRDGEMRGPLLDRFGMFGVRLALTLIRRGANTPAALAGELVPRTGLADLRQAIERNFTSRQAALKTRSALLGLDVVLRMEPRPAAAPLAEGLDRILASAHEFRELRLLAALRGGRMRLSPDLLAEAERLVGGHGTEPAERLGVGEGDVRPAVLEMLRRWRGWAESPEFGESERRAAAVVLRSCEELATGAR
ncbi:GTPase domain-containing protein [Amycolatopsis sp. K13G38]|uniref:GTPase domain-containing protein n=1 Tax=Amycolatopsis acididurans TaxID=2724524 RepID=A0ABX1J1L5_9PSEU|nr:GTPase domain-containing protein [Amycolatopsis acididurans]NKQ53539.1 GTPase domain-containing protein [Amycolatopsis acididurans]